MEFVACRPADTEIAFIVNGVHATSTLGAVIVDDLGCSVGSPLDVRVSLLCRSAAPVSHSKRSAFSSPFWLSARSCSPAGVGVDAITVADVSPDIGTGGCGDDVAGSVCFRAAHSVKGAGGPAVGCIDIDPTVASSVSPKSYTGSGVSCVVCPARVCVAGGVGGVGDSVVVRFGVGSATSD